MVKRTGWIALLSLLTACASGPAPRPYAVESDRPYLDEPGPRQVGNLYRPEGTGPFPAVLVIHGGGWIRGEKEDMEKFATRLAETGYVTYNVSYRLAPEHRWPAQLTDVRRALEWLHAHAEDLNVDPDRIGVLGYSAGAHLALMLGLKEQDRPPLRAVVAGAGPSDLRVYPDSPYVTKLIGGPPAQYPAAYADASPITHVSADDPPVFLYHGRLDQLVEVEQSQRLAARLTEADVPHTLHQLALGGHITTFLFDGGSFRRILDFLELHMAPQPTPPSLVLNRLLDGTSLLGLGRYRQLVAWTGAES